MEGGDRGPDLGSIVSSVNDGHDVGGHRNEQLGNIRQYYRIDRFAKTSLTHESSQPVGI